MMRRNIDIVNGSMPKKLISFAMPVMLTGILQLLFNTCDMIIVGQFSGSDALAAVGATTYLVNLLINAFLGLSVGVNVVAALYFGARDHENFQKTVHTAVTLSLVCGIPLAILGIIVCRPCLAAMNTPSNVLDGATLYMRILFSGIPFLLLYNFGAAILRAQGNTRQPLLFLTMSGIINVVLNIILVTVFHLSVAGVAIATVTSQFVSALLILHCLRDPKSLYCLDFRKLRISFVLLKKIFSIGIPATVNSMLFNISNTQIQSSVNIFGSAAIAGSAAAGCIDNFIYTSMNAMHQTSVNFTAQNVGAGQNHKISKILYLCLLYVTIIGVGAGAIALLFNRQLLMLYTRDIAAIEHGLVRLNIIASTYFLCGYMEVITGVLRGMGYSVFPTLVSCVCICGFRLAWIMTVFKATPSLFILFIAYPVSWIITTLILFVFYFIFKRKQNKFSIK
ncbi:MAG: MATE family efflux transporter [Ruminococcaceae bacterium]|nr:MATE family efflux transporter [Oscillospiraceae bacterium]